MQNPLIYIMLIGIFLNQFIIPSGSGVSFRSKSGDQTISDGTTSKVYIPIVYRKPCNICYYIDSNGGSDTNSGTQPDQPWKTLSKLERINISPGTIFYLKRGSVWTGKLDLIASGQDTNPITITAYGSGSAPILSNPGASGYYESVLSIRGNYFVIDHLLIQDSTGAGIAIFSDHNVIQYTEVKNTGAGIDISGHYNLITHNYIHDLHMVVNTPGTMGDDWGANGVQINSAHTEISFNRFLNCEAPSYDYGTNGGAVEIYKEGSYSSIHHNWSFQSAGFLEVSGNGTGSAVHISIFYNEVINATGFTSIHINDEHAIVIGDFYVENNTLIDIRHHDPMSGSYIMFMGAPPPNTYIFRNNIVYISDYWWVADDPFPHQNNIYYLLNPKTNLGFTLDPSEKEANPKFVDLAGYDLHLTSSSPAINAGVDLGYGVDFDLNPVPRGSAPDLGAFEYQGN